jgi:hypothetical protein
MASPTGERNSHRNASAPTTMNAITATSGTSSLNTKFGSSPGGIGVGVGGSGL